MSVIKFVKHKRDPEAIWREGGWGPRIRRREVLSGVLPGVLPFLTVQFTLETEHRWLVITFATPDTKFFIPIEGRFDKVAETCRLDLAT